MEAPRLSVPSRGYWPRRRLAIDGTTLAYVDEGPRDAEPIVLLHGYLGSHRSWRHLIDPLAATFRVIAPDWLGWGDSGRPSTLRYDYDTEVDRLRRVLGALELSACNVFAHDYGGFLALGLAQRDPARVRRLAILNSRAQGTFTPRWRALFSAISMASRIGLTRLPLVSLYRVNRDSVRREFRLGVFDDASFSYANGWMDSPDGRRFFTRFFADYRVAVRPVLARDLVVIRCPTAIVWGRHNPYLAVRIGEGLRDGIAGATLTVLDAGHFVMEERPAEVLEALRTLLARPAAG